MEARLSRKGWQGAAKDGGGERSTVWHHPLSAWCWRNSSTVSALGPLQVAQYIMLEATLLGRNGSQVGDLSRLLKVLEGVVGCQRLAWESLLCAHSLTAQSASVGRRCCGPLPVYWEAGLANIVCFRFQEELWENLWIKPNAKCWTLFPFPFLSDCFNCSVVVLMDLRPWSGSCLSDFQLLFVNNLKRKKKRNFTFWRQTCVSFLLVQTLYLTLGVLYSFLPFLLENNVKWFHNVKRKKLPLWPNAQSVLQQQRDSINSKSWFSRRNAFLDLVWAFLFSCLIYKRCLLCVNLCCTL